MTTELDVLERVSTGLTAQGLPFMLTGSFAMARYTMPRMTRDIDIVVALRPESVDLVVRKSSEYRRLEFERRQRVLMGTVETWIVSREDLILSKLVWARDAQSELQYRDVRQLLDGDVDLEYLQRWAIALNVYAVLSELLP